MRHVIKSVALPEHSALQGIYTSVDLADAYATDLPSDASHVPEVLARFLLTQQAAWMKLLMRLRDILVAGFGLKTSAHLTSPSAGAPGERIGIFKIYSRSANEIILGEDDRHLDFRLSLLCSSSEDGQRAVTLSTVVHCHNQLGRSYLFLITPFHRQIVRSMLSRAARKGWPGADA